MNPTVTRATRREWLGLAALALPSFIVVMDLTILHLAVPTLTIHLKPSPSQLLWIVDIYGFLLAGLLIPMGTLGDHVGRRRLLMIGAGMFAAASLLAALSTSAEMLIAARALLGIAGAALSPSTLSLIRSMFHDPQERTRAISIWSASFAAGSACGPLVGGFLLEHFPWGAVFLVPLPVMGVLLLVGPRLLPEFRDPTAKNVHVISIGLSLAAILTTVYGLKAIVQEGVGGIPLCAIALGGVLGVLFIRHQQRLDNPLIDIELFRSPQFSATLFVFMLNAFVMFASSYVTAQYLQLIIGLSPLQAGLWSLPSALSVIAGSMLSPVLLRWLSRSAVLIIGLLICACGFGVLTGVEAGGLLILVGGSIVAGVGAGAVSTLVPDMIVGAVSLERAGSAASLSSTSAELGGVLGLAILGSIGLGIYRLGMTGTVPQGVSSENALLAEKTLGGAVEVANHLPPEIKTQLLDAAHRAFTQTFVINAVICGTLMLLAVVIMTLTAMMTHSKQK